MTAKDFILIAAVLKAMPHDDMFAKVIHAQTVETMADALAKTNKQFNRSKFIRACGVVVKS
jgi:hypothetical protein